MESWGIPLLRHPVSSFCCTWLVKVWDSSRRQSKALKAALRLIHTRTYQKAALRLIHTRTYQKAAWRFIHTRTYQKAALRFIHTHVSETSVKVHTHTHVSESSVKVNTHTHVSERRHHLSIRVLNSRKHGALIVLQELDNVIGCVPALIYANLLVYLL
jgi:DNA integrity scanning protein DisA with diadenylate cyclase activity